MEIEFDIGKAEANVRKHGVSFDAAAAALFDPLALSMEDPDAQGESRWILVGADEQFKVLTVVYALRGNSIRIISARRATKHELREYAKRL